MAAPRPIGDPLGSVQVVGLRELQKELKQVDAELPKKLRVGQLDIARDVVEKADARARGMGGVFRHAVAMQGSLKAKGEQRYAKAVLDANKAPMILGAEFGAKRYRQFPRFRGNQHPSTWAPEGVGYVLYPTIRDNEAGIVDAYDRMLGQLFD